MNATLALMTVGLAASSTAAQPTLVPPTGPVKPSDRFASSVTLSARATPGDADSVFRITAPGSYVLSGNLRVPSGQTGIEIASDNVTIDLQGFTIFGAGVDDPWSVGIGPQDREDGEVEFRNVLVRNGSISDLETAVDLLREAAPESSAFSAVRNARVESLRITNVERGVELRVASSVKDCTIAADLLGVSAPFSNVTGCVIEIADDSGVGIWASGGNVSGCAVSLGPNANNAIGIDAIDGAVRECVVTMLDTDQIGIDVQRALVTGSLVVTDEESGIGIRAENSHLVDCVVSGVEIGFQLDGDDGLVRNCSALRTDDAIESTSGAVLIDNAF
ncbi:MAG: hypothetical protein AAGI53_03500 [Planctomycetota bacterium]